jgi:hypothetical protein
LKVGFIADIISLCEGIMKYGGPLIQSIGHKSRRDTQTPEGRWSCDDIGRNWDDAAVAKECRGLLTTTRKEGAARCILPAGFRGSMTLLIAGFRLAASRTLR